MSSVNILFWLLAALLGGLIWAIESGLASRHKSIVLSSMAATLLSMLFMMFWVEDKTELVPLEFEKAAKKKGGPAGEKEEEEGGVGEGGDGSNGSGKGSGASGTAGDGSTEYSRVPFKDCPKCPDLVIVPKGVATVGVGANDPDRQPGEQPAVVIPIAKPLAVGRLKITVQEFGWFAEEMGFQSTTACDVGKRRGVFNWRKPGFEQDERHPVVCLTQPEVRQYLAWLSDKTGRVYRLPTEIEWEHATRAGTETPFSLAAVTRSKANVGRSHDGTVVGGLFATNPWGLSDVAGNAWEMTSQCGEERAGSTETGDATDCRRLLKGGGWSSPLAAARHAARRFVKDGIATNDVGFRVVREVDDRDKGKILTVAQKKVLLQAEKDAAAIEVKTKQEAEQARQKKFEEDEAAIAKKAAAAAALEKAKAAAKK